MMVVFGILENISSLRYSSVYNVLCLSNTWVIPIYSLPTLLIENIHKVEPHSLYKHPPPPPQTHTPGSVMAVKICLQSSALICTLSIVSATRMYMRSAEMSCTAAFLAIA